MSSKIIVFGFSLFFIGVVGGMIVKPFFFSPSNTTKNNLQSATDVSDTTNPNYQAGFNAARKLVENSDFGGMFRKTSDDIRVLVGTVTAVGKNNVTLHISSGNPFDDQTLIDRTIILDASTKVTIDIQQNPVKGSSGTATAMTVVSVSSAPAEISDIKVGDMINVLASENVKTQKEFTAVEVQILPKAPAL